MLIEENLPLIEQILSQWKQKIGEDFQGYRNHIYRVVHFCFSLQTCSQEEKEKIMIASCFHDLGLWTEDSIDYLAPSILLAKKYLKEKGLGKWEKEIELMIDLHHQVREYRDNNYPLVEIFRRADLIDVSLGMIRWKLDKEYVRGVKAKFPNSGFHKKLVKLTFRQLCRNPLNLLPMMKW